MPKRPWRLKVSDAELLKLYLEDVKSPREIASLCGVARRTVYVRLKEAGVPLRVIEPALSDEQLRDLYINQLLTAKEIAFSCGSTHSAINTRLSRLGVSRTKEQDLIVRRRFAKAKLSSPAWVAAMARGRKTASARAIERAIADTNKTGRGMATCPDCKKERMMVHYDKNKPNGLICRKCSILRTTSDPAWREKNLGILLARNASPGLRARNTGANNINWKGGVTPENVKERNSPRYRQWVLHVLRRDRFTCQVCLRKNEVSGKLNAHHIETWSSTPGKRYDVDNGITACVGCHTEIIHKGSWQNEPISLEEIRQIQELVRLGSLSLDWEEAA